MTDEYDKLLIHADLTHVKWIMLNRWEKNTQPMQPMKNPTIIMDPEPRRGTTDPGP